MEHTLMMSKERMVEELTKYRNPNMTQDQAEKVVEELSGRMHFWMEMEKKFHEEATQILKEQGE